MPVGHERINAREQDPVSYLPLPRLISPLLRFAPLRFSHPD